jgi:hypothetical protein
VVGVRRLRLRDVDLGRAGIECRVVVEVAVHPATDVRGEQRDHEDADEALVHQWGRRRCQIAITMTARVDTPRATRIGTPTMERSARSGAA